MTVPTLTLETADERERWLSEFARRLANHGNPPGLDARGAAMFAWDEIRAYRDRCGEAPPLTCHSTRAAVHEDGRSQGWAEARLELLAAIGDGDDSLSWMSALARVRERCATPDAIRPAENTERRILAELAASEIVEIVLDALVARGMLVEDPDAPRVCATGASEPTQDRKNYMRACEVIEDMGREHSALIDTSERLRAELRKMCRESLAEGPGGAWFICARCREQTPSSRGSDPPGGLCDECWCAVHELVDDEWGEASPPAEEPDLREKLGAAMGRLVERGAPEYHAQGSPPKEVLDIVQANYPRGEPSGAPETHTSTTDRHTQTDNGESNGQTSMDTHLLAHPKRAGLHLHGRARLRRGGDRDGGEHNGRHQSSRDGRGGAAPPRDGLIVESPSGATGGAAPGGGAGSPEPQNAGDGDPAPGALGPDTSGALGSDIEGLRAAIDSMTPEQRDLAASGLARVIEEHEADLADEEPSGAPTGPGWPMMPTEPEHLAKWGSYWWLDDRPARVLTTGHRSPHGLSLMAEGSGGHLVRVDYLQGWGGPCLQGSADADHWRREYEGQRQNAEAYQRQCKRHRDRLDALTRAVEAALDIEHPDPVNAIRAALAAAKGDG